MLSPHPFIRRVSKRAALLSATGVLACGSFGTAATRLPRDNANRTPKSVCQANQAKSARVTQALIKALRGRIKSPGGKLQLIVKPGARADAGYFSEIYVAARPAKIRRLPLTEFSLRAKNVRIDVPHLMSRGRVRTLQSTTTLRAIVTETDVTKLLAAGRSTRSMGLKVKFLGDKVRVSGNWNMGLLNGPIIAIGRLRVAPGNKVNAEIISLKLRGAEVPTFVRVKFMEKINPLLAYDEVPFQPRFKSLTVTGPRATLLA